MTDPTEELWAQGKRRVANDLQMPASELATVVLAATLIGILLFWKISGTPDIAHVVLGKNTGHVAALSTTLQR